MNVLRTPDERFAGLPGFDFEPRYAELPDGLRMHYLDVGPPAGAPVLLLHGEPTWSFLYRKMIPVLTAAGLRCIVPDLVGFGRSDKPASPDDYTYRAQVDWLAALVFGTLDLRGATLFGQDWGGLIGLRLLAAEPDRFARVMVANTGLPTGDRRPTEAFLAWQNYAATADPFPVGRIIAGGCTRPLAPEVVAAYDAPFPDDTFKAAARTMPSLVPTSTDDPAHADNVAAWEVLRRFDRPFLCAFSDGDPITAGGERAFLGHVPGADGQPHTTVHGAGHFLQEDAGEEVAGILAAFVAG